ncbi:DUF6274 family protein [Streptomyces sp. NPDC003077]|uniref:DUF6274 family protein n=1 Tax=Streptomyces sp. NPDC003077 TaxID=3154443 RepID=UPI0033A519B9
MTTAARHETRALLRAHLSAVSGYRGYRHLTRHCPVCHRLLRLAMEPHEDMEPHEEETSPAPPSAAGPGPSDGATGAPARTDEPDVGPPGTARPAATEPAGGPPPSDALWEAADRADENGSVVGRHRAPGAGRGTPMGQEAEGPADR